MPENDELKKYLDYDGLDYLIKRIPRTRIIVTFDDVFAGETATCSLGTTTYTNTVPVTEPYQLVFSVVELGTWTIATSYLGEDYGTTVEVTGVGTTATGHVSYVNEIDGETVTPTDDITTWLKCANIEDPTITTLADVLANRSLFETLIANSNACKYMARSTTWALAEGLVPKMTSNTTPSGECIGSGDGYSSTYNKWMAFNPDESRGWLNDSSAPYIHANNYVGYTPTSSSKAILCDIILMYYSSANTVIGKIQGSNDGITWIDLTDNITVTSNTENKATRVKFTYNVGSYISYRWLCITAPTNNYTYGIKLQFYTEIDVTTNHDAMALIGKYDYCSNALLSNATWCEAIANSEYFDCILNAKVPIMTSDTAPSGTCIYGSCASTSSHPAWHAFDADQGSWFQPNTSIANSSWVGYTFTSSVNVYKAVIKHNQAANIYIEASNDGTTWTLVSNTVAVEHATYKDIKINTNGVAYNRYRAVSSTYTGVYDLRFYGRKSNEVLIPLVPTMTSDTTPSGVCSASDVTTGNYDAWRAFDSNDTTNGWCPNISTASLIGKWIKYEFPNPVKVDRIRALQKDSASTDTTYKLEASNDDTNWTTISDSLTMTKNSVVTFSDVTTSTKYSYYRITMLTNTITGTTKGFKFQFYEKGVQTNIIHSAANDTIYMMENGSQVPLCTTNSDGDGILDFTQFTDGTYTLYSSVAKDLIGLSNDYNKSVRITKTSYGCTTEVYLIPDTIKTPYWFGNIFGKSVAGSLTKNTNYLYISGNGAYFHGNIPDVDFRGVISKVKVLVSYDNDSTLNLDESFSSSNIPTSIQPFYISWYDNGSRTYNQYIAYKTAYNVDAYLGIRRDGKYYLRIHAICME